MPPPRAQLDDQCCSCWLYTNPYTGEQYLVSPFSSPGRGYSLIFPTISPPPPPPAPGSRTVSADRLHTIPGHRRRTYTVTIDGVSLQP